MDYYQARISIETARLMEQVKRLYENEKGVTITRAEVLMNAYHDSLWVTNWEKQVRERRKEVTVERIEITPSSQKLKVHISDEVKNGIAELKEVIPIHISSRSVTYGVVIEYILLAAHLKINDEKDNKKEDILEYEFKKFKDKLADILDITEYEAVIELTERLEKNTKKLL